MVKRQALFVLVTVLSVFTGIAFAADVQMQSKISEVTVYPDSALITRVADVKLNAGEYKAVFADIIPEIDENSLRVSCPDDDSVRILGAKVKREFLEQEAAQAVKDLNDQIEKLQDEIALLERSKVAISEEKQFLDSFRFFSGEQIQKDLVTKIPAVKDLDDTLKFLSAKLKENYTQIVNVELEIRSANRRLDVLRRKLAEVSGTRRKMKRSIEVELEVTKPVASSLQVSYLVGNAYWQPLYDARANFEKSEVELVSHGMIKQKTGEDWEEVVLYLSTAKPSIGGSMPYVDSWILRPYQPPAVMEDRMFMRQTKSAGVQYEAFDAKMELAAQAPMEKDREYARAEEKGIAIVYKLPRKATVKADGSEHKLSVSSQMLSAKFEYSTYPRAILNAYLGSRVTNAPNLQLLGGRVNIFLEGDFVGTSSIGNIGPGEEFDLYLGADDNVKVKREQIEKKVDETLIAGIPSPTKKTTIKNKLTVENYKSKKISVKLFEAMPVPEDDRIKVKIDKVSLEPKEKDWKDRKGVWLWELSLEPKEKKEITYTYIIEHPRDMRVEGL